MAFLMCSAIAVMVLNLLADIVVRTIDPRTRGSA
jgi:ABC-type dipeptide/oligopeptide/nickel transport system permease component